MMPKKRVANFFLQKFGQDDNFLMRQGRKKTFFTKCGQFLLLLKKIKISATLDPPNRRWGAIFNRGAPKIVVVLRLKASVFPGRSPGNTT